MEDRSFSHPRKGQPSPQNTTGTTPVTLTPDQVFSSFRTLSAAGRETLDNPAAPIHGIYTRYRKTIPYD